MDAPFESTRSGRAAPRDPRRPTRLLRWSDDQGRGGAAVTDRVLDGGSFDLQAWATATRSADPDVVVGAVYPNRFGDAGGGLDLNALAGVAAGADGAGAGDDHRVFTGDTMPTSLRALRTWATEQLDGRGFPVDEVVLVLSELSTNVERHSSGWLTVDLVETQGVLLVAVTDPLVDRLPVIRDVGPEELTGRGLVVVSSLSVVWGVVVCPTSKTVWAALHPSLRAGGDGTSADGDGTIR